MKTTTGNRTTSCIISKEMGTPERPAMRYLAWPTIGKMPDGELIVVYSGNRAAHCCPFGNVHMVRSKDQGRTWTSPETIVNTPFDDRCAGICITGDGIMVVTWQGPMEFWGQHEKAVRGWLHVGNDVVDSWRAVSPVVTREDRARWLPESGDVWSVRSLDGGKTWQEPAACPVYGPHGPILLADGRLLYAGEGFACVAESTDDGATWRRIIEQGPDRGDETVKDECHIVECDDGTIVGLLRWHPLTGKLKLSEYRILQTESTDGGRNWTPFHEIPVWGGPPHLIRLSSGYLLLSYGYRRAPFGQRACVSRDNGKTWDIENEIILRDDAIDGDLGYPASVELNDGSIYTVYYQIDKPGEKPCIMGTRWQLPAMYTTTGRKTAYRFIGSDARVRELDLGPRIDARVTEHASGGKEKKSVVGCVRGVDLDKQAGNIASVPDPNVPEQSWTFGSRMEKESGVIAIPGLNGKVKIYDAEGKVLRSCSRESISLPFSREPVYLVSEDMSARDMEKALRNAVVEGIPLTESRAYVGNLNGKTGLVIESRRRTGGAACAQVCCSIESASEGLLISKGRSVLEVRVGQEERMAIPFDKITPTDGQNLRLHYTIAEQGFPSVAGHAMVGVAVKMEKPPEIDGNGEEWKDIPATVIPGTTLYGKRKTWRGPEDLSGRMKLAWNNEALYFLIEVKDNIYVQLAEFDNGNEWAHFYASDSVELCFNRARTGNVKPFARTDILKFAMAPRVKGCDGARWGSNAGDGLRLATSVKEDGYVLEGAIPWNEYFPGLTPAENLAIPFDMKINDRDEDGPPGRKPYDVTFTQSLLWCSPNPRITSDSFGYGAIVLCT